MSELARLVEPIRAWLASQARILDLDVDSVSIEPILNWGGFVNRSFRVSAGHRRLFLKLTSYSEKRGLEVWRRVAPRIESRYHGPRMVGWLDLPSRSFSGPLFEWIDGGTPARLDHELAAGISRAVSGLHDDIDLGRQLPGPVRSCAEAYLGSYHDRFSEDLATVAADPPPFVDDALIAWLEGRIRDLEARARESPAFHALADRPVHGDLWLDNVLVDRDGGWYLLDWDGLSLGDPVIDWTMLFGPSRDHPKAATEDIVLTHAPLSRDERDRLAVYAEASQLDWVLDPLADWVQGGQEPEHGARVRLANERIHAQALEAYRERYG